MNVSAYETLLRELGFTSIERSKKLRHPYEPPTLYFNWSRGGNVYFTGYRIDREFYADHLWREIPAQQKKDGTPDLITVLPEEGKEREAFSNFLTLAKSRAPTAVVGRKPSASAGIPNGITATDVRQAIADMEVGHVKNRFGDSRLWDVLYEGRLYPPKRVIGLAARRIAGRVLLPSDFSGGEESKCHEILEDLGFRIVPKGQWDETNSVEEEKMDAEIRARTDIPETTREQLIDARRGQGRFRRSVAGVEKKGCRVTGVSQLTHLRASHIKPWCDSDDHEKLDPYNGLLLSPHIDHLFDRGYISFKDEGDLLVSRVLKQSVLTAWGLAMPVNVDSFNPKQSHYLNFHRQKVFQA
jgi:hypothetical protein